MVTNSQVCQSTALADKVNEGLQPKTFFTSVFVLASTTWYVPYTLGTGTPRSVKPILKDLILPSQTISPQDT